MKKVIVITLVILTILICGILIFNTNVEVEYVPETEIEEVDLRKTMISLYFQNKDNKELQKESRLIDSKDLLVDPFAEVLNMLIEGPETDSLQKLIPDGTKILDVNLEGECLNINFSKEFLENSDNDQNIMSKRIESIKCTVTQFTEVNSVKILIDGQEMTGNSEESLENHTEEE